MYFWDDAIAKLSRVAALPSPTRCSMKLIGPLISEIWSFSVFEFGFEQFGNRRSFRASQFLCTGNFDKRSFWTGFIALIPCHCYTVRLKLWTPARWHGYSHRATYWDFSPPIKQSTMRIWVSMIISLDHSSGKYRKFSLIHSYRNWITIKIQFLTLNRSISR